jgi:hypothetical protein
MKILLVSILLIQIIVDLDVYVDELDLVEADET